MSDLSTDGPVDDWKGNAATRCIAYKKTGDRCRRQARRGATVCDWHGAKAPQVKAKARQRIEEAADRMAKQLLRMATDEKVSDTVKLAAIRDALDRGGLAAPKQAAVEVSVRQQPWEELVADGMAFSTRAESRAARGIPDDTPALQPATNRAADVIDAEVVYERPTGPPRWAEDARAEPDQGNAPTEPGNGYQTMDEAQADIAERTRAANMRGTRIREIGM